MNKQKKLAARLYDAIWPPKPARPATRSYASARVNNKNANWTTSPTGANYERRISLSILRARARQLSRDDVHISNFLRIQRSNIIGPQGIRLQSRANMPDGKTPDTVLNQRVETAFWDWGHAETCTLSGNLDWLGVQNLIVTQLTTDGEFLVQMIDADNAFGFTLKVWDVNWLDETYNDTLPNGNRVIMSVEKDANDKPVAYWLTTPSSEINYAVRRTRTRTRVPAEQMIHGMLIFDDETQTRGVTLFAAPMLTLKNFDGYSEGVILSARMAANLFGFIESDVAETEQYTGAEDADGDPIQPVIDVSPLSVNMLNPGQKWSQLDPKQPTQQHSAFAKTILLAAGAGLGIPYFLLAGDWEATNFSSSRGGLGEARQVWKGYQTLIGSILCRRIFHEWLRRAMLSGKLKLTAREYAEVQNPTWQGRGWEYINPTQDAAADVLRLQNRLATPSQILGEQGIDYSDFLDDWDRDRKLAAEKGIDIDKIYTDAKQITPAPSETSEPDDPNGEDDTAEPSDDPPPETAKPAK